MDDLVAVFAELVLSLREIERLGQAGEGPSGFDEHEVVDPGPHLGKLELEHAEFAVEREEIEHLWGPQRCERQGVRLQHVPPCAARQFRAQVFERTFAVQSGEPLDRHRPPAGGGAGLAGDELGQRRDALGQGRRALGVPRGHPQGHGRRRQRPAVVFPRQHAAQIEQDVIDDAGVGHP